MAIVDTFKWDEVYKENGFYIPPRMMGGLKRYIMQGVIPGGFLCAVLANNMSAAVGHADGENLENLAAYIYFLVNVAPSDCWGSTKHLVAWAEAGGWNKLKGDEIAWEAFKNNLRRKQNG